MYPPRPPSISMHCMLSVLCTLMMQCPSLLDWPDHLFVACYGPEGEKDLQRWESAKRRQIQKERAASASPERDVQEKLPNDAIITTETQGSLSTN